MKFFIVLLFSTFSLCAFAQDHPESNAVKGVLNQLFDCMRTGDTVILKTLFDDSARLQTAMVTPDGVSELRNEKISNFISSIARPRTAVFDEKIWTHDIRVDGNLASAWTDYSFFVGDRLNHCGVNAFQLFKNAEGKWKIIQITDTRRKDGCADKAPDEKVNIGKLIDGWHHAAAVADEDVFFGSMTKDAIYLGTDETERWLRDDMKAWSKPYFDRETAWAFTSKNRTIYLSEDHTIAWFEELLDTWMGVCRGSGVVLNTNEGWRIAHYNLAVTVPNDLINGFIELVKTQKK